MLLDVGKEVERSGRGYGGAGAGPRGTVSWIRELVGSILAIMRSLQLSANTIPVLDAWFRIPASCAFKWVTSPS